MNVDPERARSSIAKERAIAGRERNQSGLVSLSQFREERLSTSELKHRISKQRHVRIGREVYANPAVPSTFEQKAMAAVLSGGEYAQASHETAAQLWEMLLPGPARLEITTRLERRTRVRGVRSHRSGLFDDDDVTELRGIPLTTPERTIVNLSGRLSIQQLGRMVDDAVRRKITTLAKIHEVVERLRPAPGRSQRKMRIVLDRRVAGVEVRESTLEDFVLDAIRRFGLPLPVPQHRVRVRGRVRRIDQCYVDEMVAIEAKGFQFHGLRERTDDDAMRENALELAGFSVLKFTSAFSDWQVARDVAVKLGLPAPPRPRKGLTFSSGAPAIDRLDAAGCQGDR